MPHPFTHLRVWLRAPEVHVMLHEPTCIVRKVKGPENETKRERDDDQQPT